MSIGLRRAVRAGAIGFACGLILAILFSVRAEQALIRAGLVGLIISAATFLASSLNVDGTKADEGDGLYPGPSDQDGA